MPDDTLTAEDFTAAEVLGGEAGVWDGASLELGLRFTGNDLSAAIVMGFSELPTDHVEHKGAPCS